jgi:hypothetical protein
MVPVAKGIIAPLNRIATTEDGTPPDALVLELGDGVIGPYGVDQILEDMELQRLTGTHVLAAADLAGAWACDQLFRTRYRAEIGVVVGPATDTDVGKRYIQTSLGIPAVNARSEAGALADLVAEDIAERKAWEGGSGPKLSFNGPRRVIPTSS